MSTRPRIGISMDVGSAKKGEATDWIKQRYRDAILSAGGLPLLLPSVVNSSYVDEYMILLDAVLVTGGDFDIDPSYYGAKDDGQVRNRLPERTGFEWTLLERAWAKGLPILGICGGEQLLNVFRGGTLLQHVDHHEDCQHEIQLTPSSNLSRILGTEACRVGSSHHQAVEHLGKDLSIAAVAADGVVEAVESTVAEQFALGVQWHPEADVLHDPAQARIFEAFIEASRNTMVRSS